MAPLDTYRGKRDFTKTTEPRGSTRKRKRREPRFVVQKHAASRVHYDLRLEAGGVLKSWAVPKGPSGDPSEKVFATPTEDHPLDYAEFEGVIPKGEYGAGAVIVWDAGTFRNLTTHEGAEVPFEDAIEEGHVSFWLEGQKLRGGYALTRIRRGRREGWLLVKMRDDAVDTRRDPRTTMPASVRSGRTVTELGDAAP